MEARDHWLYRIIPRGWDNVRWYNFYVWMDFGNDGDGIFGEDSPIWRVEVYDKEGGPSFWVFLKWWARNPQSNYSNVLLRHHGAKFYLYRGGRWWYWDQPTSVWSGQGEPELTVQLWPPGLVVRTRWFESYWLWKPTGEAAVPIPTLRIANAPAM